MRRQAFLLALPFLVACGDSDEGKDALSTTSEFASGADLSHTVYDESVFATYRLEMDPADWAAIVNTPQDNTFRRATLTWQDEVVPSVGVRPSGQSTRMPGNPKPSLRLDFDAFSPGREWRGIEKIKLDSLTADTSFMRDRLAYSIFRRMGVPAPRSAHARLFVNGEYKGVYEVEEPVAKEFLKSRWTGPVGNLYEVEHAHPRTYSWEGSDPAAYVPDLFTAQINPSGDYGDLVALCDLLNNVPAGRRLTELDARILEMDAFLTYLAVVGTLANFDSIVGDWGCRNHYLYRRPSTRKFLVLPWDVDKSFGATGWRGADRHDQSIWHNFDLTPATSWIRGDAEARATYQNKVRQVMDVSFAPAKGHMDFIYAQIREAVYQDPYKGITNDQFDASLQALKDWVDWRPLFVVREVP